jgi:RNA polymerase sigma-70 factor (ECF subfamily)
MGIPTKHNVFERPVSQDGNGEINVVTTVGVAEKDDWSDLMRSAVQGNSVAYYSLLRAITPVLRATARRALAQAGQPVDQSEDIVQDTLLAIHLKRHTWDTKTQLAPWLFAIARKKLIDSIRRRRGRVFVNIDDFSEIVPTGTALETFPASEIDGHVDELPLQPREVLHLIAIDGVSIKATAKKLSMSEGAVRVALHRALSKLAAKLRT